jgi:hypothetical protein
MRGILLGSLLVFAPALMAADPPEQKPKDEKPKVEKPAKSADDFDALTKEIMEEQKKAQEAFNNATTNDEKQKIIKDFRAKVQSYSGRFLAFAEKHPKDAKAVQALQMVIQSNRGSADAKKAGDLLLKDHGDNLQALVLVITSSPRGGNADKAVDLMLKSHAKNPQLVNLAQQMGQAGLPAAEKLIRGLLKAQKDAKVQAQLTFALGKAVEGRSEGPDVPFAQAQKLQKEAEDIFSKLAASKDEGLKQVAGQAKEALEGIRKFGIGKTAPDIKGEDTDGKKFELKDYRGKVVLLDFWGSW